MVFAQWLNILLEKTAYWPVVHCAENRHINTAKNKHQCWEQANQWFPKTNINVDNKENNDC